MVNTPRRVPQLGRDPEFSGGVRRRMEATDDKGLVADDLSGGMTESNAGNPHRRIWGDIPMDEEWSVDSNSLGNDRSPKYVVKRMMCTPGDFEAVKILTKGTPHTVPYTSDMPMLDQSLEVARAVKFMSP